MSNPEWGYRLKDGEVESKLFPEGREKGWEDTPAKCVEKPKKAKK